MKLTEFSVASAAAAWTFTAAVAEVPSSRLPRCPSTIPATPNASRPAADDYPIEVTSASIEQTRALRLATNRVTLQTDRVATRSRAVDPTRRSSPRARATSPNATPGALRTRTAPPATKTLSSRARRLEKGCRGGVGRALSDSRAGSSSGQVGTKRSAAYRLQDRSARRPPF